MKRKTLIASICTIATCVATITGLGVTFSWLRRDWAPQFYYDNLGVETSGALAILIENGDGTPHTKIDLNADIVKMNDFVLKQVSNASGESDDFFTIDYTHGEGKERLSYLKATSSYKELGKENGYIESRFQITTLGDASQTATRWVYIDSFKSYIECGTQSSLLDASESIRVSFTVEGLTEDTRIFKKTVYTRDPSTGEIDPTGPKYYHTGAIDTVEGGVHVGDGMYIYKTSGAAPSTEYNPDAIRVNTTVYEFSDFNGGFRGYDENDIPYDFDDEHPFDTSKALFSLGKDAFRWVTLRIWLEGFDDNTKDDIAGDELNFKLMFRAYDEIKVDA